MLIDCDRCEIRGKACRNCVVSFITIPLRPGINDDAPVRSSPRGGGSFEHHLSQVRMDAAQARAVEIFAAAGMIAPLRHQAAAGTVDAPARGRGEHLESAG